MVVCSEVGCGITLCVARDESACITWDAPKGSPWLCVKHNSRRGKDFIKVSNILWYRV
jgi:hypothetical protein